MAYNFHIVRYNSDLKRVWNDFVESSKNGTFLFNRDYMEYHKGRFEDGSILIFKNDKLYALLPANLSGDTLYSHQGLTYGGLIMNRNSTAQGVLDIFDVLARCLKDMGINRLMYKPVPYHYSRIPAQEDLYALFRLDAKLIARNIASVVEQDNRLEFSKLRKRCLKKSRLSGVVVSESDDLETFWAILEENLNKKYKALPVHSYEEIKKLADKFPQIRLFSAFKDERMIGGVLCFFTARVVRVQYISANDEGKEYGAIDAIMAFLLDQHCKDFPYFDFGTSNEDGGRFLNESLIHQKEGFGARGICYDTWKIDL